MAFKKTKAVGKFLWKHKGKSAIVGGVAGAFGAGTVAGAKATLGAINYNPAERRAQARANKQMRKINEKLQKDIVDYVRENKI